MSRTQSAGSAHLHIKDLMDPDLLAGMIAEGYIRERQHSTLPLRILGYTETAQYARMWNPATLQCRGLVVDDADIVVARSFPKFFNDAEHGTDTLPALDLAAPVEVTDKLDGSLGISVPTPDGLTIATRGSFESDQAKWATNFYRRNYADRFEPEPGYTYLWEIIFAANRIVVDYDYEDLVLLGAVHNESGRIVSVRDVEWPGRKAQQFPYSTLGDALAAPVRDNAEGFVIRYLDSDLMVKVKLERYVQLHKIITGLSEKTVWEHASAGQSFEDLIADLPDEFHRWVTDVWDDLAERRTSAEADARALHRKLIAHLGGDFTRKDYAMAVQEYPMPEMRPYLFMLLDDNNTKLDAAIWRSLKPSGDTYMLNAEDAA